MGCSCDDADGTGGIDADLTAFVTLACTVASSGSLMTMGQSLGGPGDVGRTRAGGSRSAVLMVSFGS